MSLPRTGRMNYRRSLVVLAIATPLLAAGCSALLGGGDYFVEPGQAEEAGALGADSTAGVGDGGPCDLVNPASCGGDGQGCVVPSGNFGNFLLAGMSHCGPVGSLGQGGACQQESDCAASLTCLGGVCTQWCYATGCSMGFSSICDGGSACPSGSSCVPWGFGVAPPGAADGQLYGICEAGVCTPASTQCSDGGVQTCTQEGTWSIPVQCVEQVCIDGGCTGSCAPAEARCADGGVLVCSSGATCDVLPVAVETCQQNGTWGPPAACATQTCIDASCSGPCIPGTIQCANNGVQTCTQGGTWSIPVQCLGQTCVNGACVGSCAPGDARCSDGGVQVCSDGSCDVLPVAVERCQSGGTSSPPIACTTQTCIGGSCSGPCIPGETQCSGNGGIQTCDSTGSWGAPVPCASQGCAPSPFGGAACTPQGSSRAHRTARRTPESRQPSRIGFECHPRLARAGPNPRHPRRLGRQYRRHTSRQRMGERSASCRCSHKSRRLRRSTAPRRECRPRCRPRSRRPGRRMEQRCSRCRRRRTPARCYRRIALCPTRTPRNWACRGCTARSRTH